MLSEGNSKQMEVVTVVPDNIDTEHICCALTDKKGETGVSSKKAWMKERFGDGLVFKKLDVRGKAFIEYLPAEKAWVPIQADGYLHIDCFWVSGKFQGQGYAGRLLGECIADAKAQGKRGLTVLSSEKKKPYLSDPAFLLHKGFRTADTASPYFSLLYLPFEEGSPVPRFRDCAKRGKIPEQGMVLYYADQCPFAHQYTLKIMDIAQRRGLPVAFRKFETTEQAQNSPSPFPSYSFYYNGDFVTHEIFSEKKFEAFLDSAGL
jgi:ribosomal protein S18 acetylase RimI-like enzyme